MCFSHGGHTSIHDPSEETLQQEILGNFLAWS